MTDTRVVEGRLYILPGNQMSSEFPNLKNLEPPFNTWLTVQYSGWRADGSEYVDNLKCQAIKRGEPGSPQWEYEGVKPPNSMSRDQIRTWELSKPLASADHSRCQAEKPNGATAWTVGGTPGLVRCREKPAVIVEEVEPGGDGRHGEMSLCLECLIEFSKKRPLWKRVILKPVELGVRVLR